MHRFLLQARAIALVLGAALVVASAQHAMAGIIELYSPPLWIEPSYLGGYQPPWLPEKKEKGGGGTEVDPSPTATFEMNNIGGYMRPCEPNPGGLMTKTQWGGDTVKKAGRVVIHTFGSEDADTGGELNTVLAAYSGSSCASLDLLAVNDNRAVPGIGTTESLVQFNVAADKSYRVQIGGRNGAEGDIFATVSVLPPGGGLSVSLAKVGSIRRPGQDYVCRLQFSGASCETATFVVHNSTNRALTVTPTSSLGGAFVNPAVFTLAAGQAKAATFKFNAAFNKTTLRTLAGYFILTGRVGSTVISRADYLGLVSVETGAEGPNVLRASVSRQVGTAPINGGFPFEVKLMSGFRTYETREGRRCCWC